MHKIMQIKEWLNRGRDCEGMITDLELEKEEARKQVFGSGSNYRTAFHRYLNYEKKLDEEIDRLFFIKQEIFEIIKRMPPGAERRLLQLRYLCMVDTWENVAEKMHYDLRWIHRKIHPNALKMAERIFQEQNENV